MHPNTPTSTPNLFQEKFLRTKETVCYFKEHFPKALYFPLRQLFSVKQAQGLSNGVCGGFAFFAAAYFKIEGTFLGYSAETLQNYQDHSPISKRSLAFLTNSLVDWDLIEHLDTAFQNHTQGYIQRTPENSGFILLENPTEGGKEIPSYTYQIPTFIDHLIGTFLSAPKDCVVLKMCSSNIASHPAHAFTCIREGNAYWWIDANHGVFRLGSETEFRDFLSWFLRIKYAPEYWDSYGEIPVSFRFKQQLSTWDRFRCSFIFHGLRLAVAALVLLCLTLILPSLSTALPITLFLGTAWVFMLFCGIEHELSIFSKLINFFFAPVAAPTPPVPRALQLPQYLENKQARYHPYLDYQPPQQNTVPTNILLSRANKTLKGAWECPLP